MSKPLPDWKSFIETLSELEIDSALSSSTGARLALYRFKALSQNPEGFEDDEDIAFMSWNASPPKLGDEERGQLAYAFTENGIPLTVDEQNKIHLVT